MQKDNMTDSKDEAAQAVELEAEAKAQPDVGTYTHKFKKPFTHENRTVEELHFDFDRLTGRDYTTIEDEMNRAGKTLVVPEYSSSFLEGALMRACTDRDEKGIRIVSAAFMGALPIREYKALIGKARSFFLRQA